MPRPIASPVPVPVPQEGAADQTRRTVLKGGAALLAAVGFGPVGCALGPGRRFRADPFRLGIASGDPLPDRVVIWTRLAPAPLAPDGGMTDTTVPVRWDMAEDDSFRRIVRSGETVARPAWAHSVHVDVAGLDPGRPYYYRFIAGGALSPTGRARTAPAPGAAPGEVRIAQAGCQNYESGFYTAWAQIAREDYDLVVHTGDYIYEGGPRRSGAAVRHHPDHVCRTLAEYRQRYALYKADPDLRAAHAAHSFAAIYDDHEVANNWAADVDGKGHGGAEFATRRRVALRAWYEHMPVRRPQRPVNGWIRGFRTLDYGTLARLNFLDTRGYRTPQPCGGRRVPSCPAAMDPHATILGDHQERWLQGQLSNSSARWNVIAQQVLMAELDRDTDPRIARYDMDKWDGYRAARRRLLSFLDDAGIRNPIVLSGDLHRHVAAALRPDFARPETRAVATEFVNTSISSNGDGHPGGRAERAWPAQNPHVAFVANQRGYCRHVITETAWRTDFRVLDRVATRDGEVTTRRAFTVESNRPALVSA